MQFKCWQSHLSIFVDCSLILLLLPPSCPHWWFWEGPVITGLCISDRTRGDLVPFMCPRRAVADPGLPLWPHRTAPMPASITSQTCLLGREVRGNIKICVTASWIFCFSLDFVSCNEICAFLLLAACGWGALLWKICDTEFWSLTLVS